MAVLLSSCTIALLLPREPHSRWQLVNVSPFALLSYRRHERSGESECSLSCSFAPEAPAQPQMTTCVLPEMASRTACVQVLLPFVSASPSPCNPTH